MYVTLYDIQRSLITANSLLVIGRFEVVKMIKTSDFSLHVKLKSLGLCFHYYGFAIGITRFAIPM